MKRTLDSIVREYILMEGKSTMNGYPRILQFAIQALKDINYDVKGNISYLSEYPENGVIPIPDDLIKVIRVGFRGENEEFVPIAENHNLVLKVSHDDKGNNVYPFESGGRGDYNTSEYSQHFSHGESIGRYYGAGGGTVRGYRINEETQNFEFSSNVNGEVVIEYLGDIKRVNGEFTVHPFLVDSIIDYINYAKIRALRGVSPSEKQAYKTLYVNTKNHAIGRFISMGMQDMENAAHKGYMQAPKYK